MALRVWPAALSGEGVLALAVDELVERGAVIAVAVRTDEPGTDDVAVTLRRLRREAVVRLPLPGLGVDDVGIVVRRLAGRPSRWRSRRSSTSGP
jgi:hypothetical protein